MRLSARQIHQLALEYIRWRRQVDGANVTEHVKLFLRYLARGGYYHHVSRAEGLAESSAMVNLHKAAAFFQHNAARYKLPRLISCFNILIFVYRLHIYRVPRKWVFGLKPKFKTELKTKVNLSIGLKLYFRIQIKVWFKTIV